MIVAENKNIKKCPVSLQPDIENLLQDLTPDDFASASRQEKDDFIQDRQSVSYWKDAWRRLKKNAVAMVALGVIIFLFLFAFVGFGLINCIAYIFADLVNNRFMVALTPFMMYFFYYIVCSSIGRDGPMEYLTASKLRYSELKFMIIDMVILIVLITVSYFVRSRRKDAI